jgi:D-3-phosphoglycerate dehydrogenase
MTVLVADKFETSGLEGLRSLGADVFFEPDLKGEELRSRLCESEAEILVVRGTQVTKAMIDDSRLAVVIRAGAGYNTIDVDAASARGIRVTNCPGKNSQAVAELAFGLIVACDRRIPDNVADLRNGIWNKKKYSVARGLHGRTLGLVGAGKIAMEMIPKARAFGMNVVNYSRWMTSDTAAALGIGRAENPAEVAAFSDIISVHVSLTPETRGSLNKEFFDAVRPGSIFINTSRAEVVDQAALLAAIREKGIVAGLDVFEGEPDTPTGTYDGELRNEPNVYCTHHIGASTEQAQESIAAEVVRIVREYKATGTVPNVVNIKRAEVATHLLVVRHLDRIGVLAYILGILKDEGVNVQEMENIVLGGATSAIAQISVDKEPTAGAILEIKRNPNVFDASVFGIKK